MKRQLSILFLAFLCAAAAVPVAPLVGGGRDLTQIPPEPAAREKELAAKTVSLGKAIEACAKGGGVVASARFNWAGQIEMSVFQGGSEKAVVVDSNTGAELTSVVLPRFPGDPVTGEGTPTASGVICYDLKVGTGAEVIAKESSCSVHCTGWLVDGTRFWSSHDGAGQPLDCSMKGGLVQGWLDGIPGMKAGGKRKLVIPSHLGYGPQGRPPAIPPNAVLVFDIELLAVK